MDLEDEWGDFAGDSQVSAPVAQFQKGQDILYQTREGTWIPGKVISVDLTIQPPSYCVQVQGNLRETEEWRLKSAPTFTTNSSTPHSSTTSTPRPAPDDAAPAPLNPPTQDDDFSDFFAAPDAVPAPASPPRRPSQHSQRSPHSPKLPEDSFREFLARAAPSVAHELEEEFSKKEEEEIQATLSKKTGFGSDLGLQTANGNGAVGQHNVAGGWDDDFADFSAADDGHVATSNGGGNVQQETLRAPAAPAAIESSAVPPSLSPQHQIQQEADTHNPFVRNLHASSTPTSPVKLPSSFTTAGTAPGSDAVQEYGIAWTEMLKKAAEYLEAGNQVISKAFSASSELLLQVEEGKKEEGVVPSLLVLGELLKLPQGQQYFAGLGRIYVLSSIVRLAADALGLLSFVPELSFEWKQCEKAWTSSGSSMPPLRSIALDSASNIGVDLLKELEAVENAAIVLKTLPLDDFPRMLAWSDGLDALTLLPFKAFSLQEQGEIQCLTKAVEWPVQGRFCLSFLAKFWLSCVSSAPPDLE